MGCVNVQILVYGGCECADTALGVLRLGKYCSIGCVTVQILQYGLCDSADTAL